MKQNMLDPSNHSWKSCTTLLLADKTSRKIQNKALGYRKLISIVNVFEIIYSNKTLHTTNIKRKYFHMNTFWAIKQVSINTIHLN